jgi:hypothetical protein
MTPTQYCIQKVIVTHESLRRSRTQYVDADVDLHEVMRTVLDGLS